MRNDIIDPDSSHGFKNEKFFSVAILILIIVAIGGFAILRSDAEINLDFIRGEADPSTEESEESEEGIELEEESEDTEESDSEDSEENDVGLAQYEEGDNEGIAYEEVERNDEYSGQSYKVEAESGDGLTHVARKATEAHIETKGGGEDLTAEHKVYIEDYIQKNLDHETGWLQTGETVEVPESLIDEAIEEANQLTEDQLQNLSQYTVST
ncbi:MAG: hypothetical protein ACQEP3_01520 [Patescibacteria group bacterium]